MRIFYLYHISTIFWSDVISKIYSIISRDLKLSSRYLWEGWILNWGWRLVEGRGYRVTIKTVRPRQYLVTLYIVNIIRINLMEVDCHWLHWSWSLTLGEKTAGADWLNNTGTIMTLELYEAKFSAHFPTFLCATLESTLGCPQYYHYHIDQGFYSFPININKSVENGQTGCNFPSWLLLRNIAKINHYCIVWFITSHNLMLKKTTIVYNLLSTMSIYFSL